MMAGQEMLAPNEFLVALYDDLDGDLFINLAAIDTDGSFFGKVISLNDLRASGDVQEFIEKHQAEKRNIYFGINPLATIPDSDKAAIKNVDEDIWFVHADIDPPKSASNIETWREGKRKELETLECAVLIDSGRGFWVIYALSEPVCHERAEEINRMFVNHSVLKADPAATSVANLVRMPGTINYPNAAKRRAGRKPAKASIIKFATERYTPNNFVLTTNLDDLPEDVIHIIRTATRPENENGPQYRGPSEARMAVMIRMFANEIDEDRVRQIISNPDSAIAPENKRKMKSRWCEQELERGKKAYERSIPAFIREFNEKYFVTRREGKTIIGEEIFDDEWQRHRYSFTTANALNLFYANDKVRVGRSSKPKSAVWVEHRSRRTYSEMVMRPDLTPGNIGDGRLNMWRGWPVQSADGDCGYFDELVNEIICDGDATASDYFWGWMARGIQKPHVQAEVALVMRGGRGTGKGTFATYYGSLFGDHFVHISNQSHLTGNFNGHLLNCLCLFADEALWAGSKQAASVLKALITEDRVAVEDKFMPMVNVRNRLKVILASNERWVVPAGADERRFCVVEANENRQKDLAWFSKLRRQMQDGGHAALLWRLQNYDLSSFEVRDVPNTVALDEQKDHGLGAFEAFWRDELAEGDHGSLLHSTPSMSWQLVPKIHLYGRYLESRRQRASKDGPTDLVNFGKRLCEVLSDGWPKRGQRMQWQVAKDHWKEGNTYRLPPLSQCRAQFEESIGRSFEWVETEQEPDPSF